MNYQNNNQQTQYQKDPNNGVLFTCAKKSDKSPDYIGTVTVVTPGVYTVFGRKKVSSKQGKELIELSFKPEQQAYKPQSFIPAQQSVQPVYNNAPQQQVQVPQNTFIPNQLQNTGGLPF